MLTENPNIIKYTNHFIFENELLAFRKKQLFNISKTPKHIPFNKNANCWIVNRKQLTLSKAKELIVIEEKEVDVSDLQWHQQINLEEVFNL